MNLLSRELKIQIIVLVALIGVALCAAIINSDYLLGQWHRLVAEKWDEPILWTLLALVLTGLYSER